MTQLGILCLCLLTLSFSTAAISEQIVEYSMYDEFGDIMFNAPGRLVKNGGYKSYRLEEGTQSQDDLSNYRYRTDNNQSIYSGTFNRESDVLTTYKKNHYNTNQAWNFRPLDEKKEKKIIKIEDKPVVPFQAHQMLRSSPMQYQMPYQMGTPMVTPAMPMVPLMPGLVYPMLPY